MSDDLSPDPLVRHLDTAAEAMRQANHHTDTDREVTDLYPVLGALFTLFSRFDQLAGYLTRTIGDAYPIDFRHDEDGPVTATLTQIADAVDEAGYLTRAATRALTTAWSQLGHLVLDIPDLVCPECGEPAHRGIPTDLTPAQRSRMPLPRYRHADGTQLCPVVGPDGYQPASPHAPDSPSSIPQDEPDPEGQL